MMLFTELCGLGVVFLIYVLVQFWREGHPRLTTCAADNVIEFAVKNKPTVVIATQPNAERAQGSATAVAVLVRRSSTLQKQLHRNAGNPAEVLTMKYFSGLAAQQDVKRG